MEAKSHSSFGAPIARLALSLLFCSVCLTASAAGASADAPAESVEVFVSCNGDTTKPSSACYFPTAPTALIKSPTDLEFDVCWTLIATPTTPTTPTCREHEHAVAGAFKGVQVSFEIGEHIVTWRRSSDGTEIGSWRYVSEEPPGILHVGGASDQFSGKVRPTLAGADFLKGQNPHYACRKVYVRPSGRIGVCFIEYKLAGRFHLLRGTANIPAVNGVVVKVLSDRSWVRKPVRCALPNGVRGRLVSNNGCGRAAPYDDAQLITSQLIPHIPLKEPSYLIRWRPILGPGALGYFSAEKLGRTYKFTNDLGDWFAYTP